MSLDWAQRRKANDARWRRMEEYLAMGNVSLQLIEKIEDVNIKNVEIRKSGTKTDLRGNYKKYGLHRDAVIGFVSISKNVRGWIVFVASNEDKSEFGADIYRLFSPYTDTTTVVKINLKSGKIIFMDNKKYIDTMDVVFNDATSYKKLLVDGNDKAYKAFNV